jgi:hypothetical protein
MNSCTKMAQKYTWKAQKYRVNIDTNSTKICMNSKTKVINSTKLYINSTANVHNKIHRWHKNSTKHMTRTAQRWKTIANKEQKSTRETSAAWGVCGAWTYVRISRTKNPPCLPIPPPPAGEGRLVTNSGSSGRHLSDRQSVSQAAFQGLKILLNPKRNFLQKELYKVFRSSKSSNLHNLQHLF